MQLAHLDTRPPHLVQAIEALARRVDNREAAQILLDELSGINVLVARKFTNERTADGLLDAFYLTMGCISLGISQANLPEDGDAQLSFLLHHGAEYVFQMGFRHIKDLSALPYTAFVTDFDNDPHKQQLDIKLLFAQICRADPATAWTGDRIYNHELLDRKNIQAIIDCAKWLRKKHYAGPVRGVDMDAYAVIAIAVIFAIAGEGRIVARTGQEELESLIRLARATRPDIDAGWNELLNQAPPEYQPILRERMDEYRNTIIKKILSKASVKSVLIEIQKNFAGDEQNIDYQ
ncbi:MAG: hypothetical protein A2061_06460 [Gallionellales bacterium GWA2_59_43]|nr:MAG: hypothetical protein A2061_06460 [Gallionellales bacterium GWA2_59_43]